MDQNAASTLSPMVKGLIAVGVLFAAWKYGPPTVKGMAIGVAGFMAVNQLPVVREGIAFRLAA